MQHLDHCKKQHKYKNNKKKTIYWNTRKPDWKLLTILVAVLSTKALVVLGGGLRSIECHFLVFSKRACLSRLIISKATRTLLQQQWEMLPEVARARHPLQPTQHRWLSITQLFMLKELSNKVRSFWTAPTPHPYQNTHTPLIDMKYLIEGKWRQHFDWFLDTKSDCLLNYLYILVFNLWHH